MTQEILSLAQSLKRPAKTRQFAFWIVGETPLITHAWSLKVKEEMLGNMVKTVQIREDKDPEQEFRDSLYTMGKDSEGKDLYGFPVTAIKKAIVQAAHKDKGIQRTKTQTAVRFDAQMVRVMPGRTQAICDMPLVRVYGSPPEMREDSVRIGKFHDIANLAYRAQFTVWAIHLTGFLNTSDLSQDQFATLVSEAGLTQGLGEWRNERSGVFGEFQLPTPKIEAAWDAFKAGTGLLPVPVSHQQLVAA